MEIEIWKYVAGGQYQVSNLGNIYSLHTRKTIRQTDRKGYRRFKINGKSVSVHRLVAEAFIPNPLGLPVVNHKDGDKSNNHISNLEWVTQSENILHAHKTGLIRSKMNKIHQ